ncbi:MAG: PhoU domain-containing protein [Bacteroidia bacterium]|nr:hypothetical protein [Bacteroidia bacterium]MDW8134911.1 PhoU domain-containing protein [Bacteroidia bacterium]
MSLIEIEINKLRSRAYQVVQQLHQQLALLDENVRLQKWSRLVEIEKLRAQGLEGDMRLDRRCARILALHQPVANDLRFILAVMRMHYYVEEISERLVTIGLRLARYAPLISSEKLQSLPLALLVERVKRLLEICLDAFFRADTERSKRIDEEDNAVDEAYEACMELIKRSIMPYISHKEATIWIEIALVVKALEKVADYAIDIADASIYYAEGVFYWHRFARRLSAQSEEKN